MLAGIAHGEHEEWSGLDFMGDDFMAGPRICFDFHYVVVAGEKILKKHIFHHFKYHSDKLSMKTCGVLIQYLMKYRNITHIFNIILLDAYFMGIAHE